MPRGVADERRFEAWNRLRPNPDEPISDVKSMIREQFHILLLDEEAAVDALPHMLTGDRVAIEQALTNIRTVTNVGGAPEGELAKRLKQIEIIFNSASATAARILGSVR